MKYTISVIGSGNWGTAISKLIAENIMHSTKFTNILHMYTHEEIIEGQKLTEIINTKKENIKYLPGCKLPENLISTPDLQHCIEESDILIFVLPHQFLESIIQQIMNYKFKEGCFAVSLIKGIIFSDNQIIPISSYIHSKLRIGCAVLMGANIASQVADKCISEGTLGCKIDKHAKILVDIFDCHTYRVTHVKDVYGVELCGTLKNVICVGYGIATGLKYTSNTTVAILRNGLKEIIKFTEMFFDDVKIETFFESSGMADLFVSALSGRNSKCGEKLSQKKSLCKIEDKMCGQMLQGPSTSKDVYKFLEKQNMLEKFPFFCTVYKICYLNEPCESILNVFTSGYKSNK